jgi:hypothetical protein
MCVWKEQTSVARISSSATCWNQAGSRLRSTSSTSRENKPSVPSAASALSLNSGVGTFRAVSIWPTNEPV